MYKIIKNNIRLSSPDVTISQSSVLQNTLSQNGWKRQAINQQVKQHSASAWSLEEDNFIVYHRTVPLKNTTFQISQNSQSCVRKNDTQNDNFCSRIKTRTPLPQNHDPLNPSVETGRDGQEKVWCQNLMDTQSSSDTNLFFTNKNVSVETCKFSDGLGENDISILSDVLDSMRYDTPSFVLAFDTEFYYTVDGDVSDRITPDDCKNNRVRRHILSWQFCFVVPGETGIAHQLLVFGKSEKQSLSLMRIIGYILEEFCVYSFYHSNDFGTDGISIRDISCWKVPVRSMTRSGSYMYSLKKFNDFNKALDACRWCQPYYNALARAGESMEAPLCPYDNYGVIYGDKAVYVPELDTDVLVGYTLDKSKYNKSSIDVTLVCHSGKADLTTFSCEDIDIVKYLKEIQGGLCTLKEIKMNVPVYTRRRRKRFYPVNLSVRDTMCFAPNGKKSLAALGSVIGVEKIEIDETKYSKGDMLNFLKSDPVAFCEYAMNDAFICLSYCGALWLYNRTMPLTLASAAVRAAVNIIKTDMDCKNNEDFMNKFRGMKSTDKGLVSIEDRFVKNVSMTPVSEQANRLQSYGSESYKGGYNGSMDIGYVPKVTYDYDLSNAYPTCMSQIYDVDWMAKDLILMMKEKFYIDDLYISSPFMLAFAYGSFEFPEDVKYPCIPVNVGGCITYPRAVKDSMVYMAAPEMYLAIKLGAKIYADSYIVARNRNVKQSAMFNVVKKFIAARNIASSLYGPKSVIALLMKEGVNSIYGKCAQNVLNKKSWSAMEGKMVSISDSPLTSPVLASLTTSAVRSVILAAMNELSSKGYSIYSVTTDGFISDAPPEVVYGLNLFGMTPRLKSARYDLTGEGSLWQVKHQQDDLINITTRGNTSLYIGGVNAHNSYKSGEESDSIEDRIAYENAIMNRQGPVTSREIRFTTFRDLSDSDNRSDFIVTSKIRNISMDFDFKRKPVKESLRSSYSKIVKENDVYKRIPCDKDDPEAQEIACLNTEPYKDVKEYLLYKSVADRMPCLRTVSEWEEFFRRIEIKLADGRTYRIKDDVSSKEHAILFSCAMAHRLKVPLKEFGDTPVSIRHFDNNKETIEEKVKWMNSFMQHGKLTVNDWKNAGRAGRISSMLPEKSFIDIYKKMLECS